MHIVWTADPRVSVTLRTHKSTVSRFVWSLSRNTPQQCERALSRAISTLSSIPRSTMPVEVFMESWLHSARQNERVRERYLTSVPLGTRQVISTTSLSRQSIINCAATEKLAANKNNAIGDSRLRPRASVATTRCCHLANDGEPPSLCDIVRMPWNGTHWHPLC